MLPLTVFVKPTRHYVSMRVHGTSVHINRGDPPDSPAKILNVERLGRGTRVSANWDFEVPRTSPSQPRWRCSTHPFP